MVCMFETQSLVEADLKSRHCLSSLISLASLEMSLVGYIQDFGKWDEMTIFDRLIHKTLFVVSDTDQKMQQLKTNVGRNSARRPRTTE